MDVGGLILGAPNLDAQIQNCFNTYRKALNKRPPPPRPHMRKKLNKRHAQISAPLE